MHSLRIRCWKQTSDAETRDGDCRRLSEEFAFFLPVFEECSFQLILTRSVSEYFLSFFWGGVGGEGGGGGGVIWH